LRLLVQSTGLEVAEVVSADDAAEIGSGWKYLAYLRRAR
jgi:hypothetical protein